MLIFSPTNEKIPIYKQLLQSERLNNCCINSSNGFAWNVFWPGLEPRLYLGLFKAQNENNMINK